jgi:hypothetical protein
MGTTLGVAIATSNAAQAEPPAFLSQFSNVVHGASTVPANGDVNPYGIVVVPRNTGKLVEGGERGIWFVDDGTNTLNVFF